MTTRVTPAKSPEVPGQLEAQLGGDADVEAGERLVEQQHGGLAGQGAGQRDPLCLTTRQLVRTARGERADPEPVEPLLSDPLCLGPPGAPAPGPERDVVQRTEVREQLLALEGQAEAPLTHQQRHRTRARPPLTGDLDPPRVTEQPGDRVQQRRLPGAVGAEHRDHLAGLRRERRPQPAWHVQVDVQSGPPFRAGHRAHAGHGTRSQRSRSAARTTTETTSRIRLSVRATSTSPWSSL